MHKAWPKIKSGTRFGKLTVIDELKERDAHNHIIYRLQCDCGGTRVADKMSILKKRIKFDCGCGRKEQKERAFSKMLFKKYQIGAASRKISFSLKFDDFMQLVSLPCHYCGDAPKTPEGYTAFKKNPVNGIDRKNSSLGYNLENCVPCCKQCNISKGKSSLDEFISWALRVQSFTPRVL